VIARRNDPRREQARYQGERLHLRVNRLAAADLRDVLAQAAGDPSRSPTLRRLSLVLPDGRELDVSVQVTDDGDIYNEHGEWVDDDGRAHADISGDFELHVAARQVIEAASTPYYDRPTDGRAVEVDERRIQWKLDLHLPAIPGDGAREVLRDDVYRRATAAADATRDERITDAHRFAQRHARLRTGAADNRTGRSEPGRDVTGRGQSL
jgi:hypothetical protein